MLNNITKLLTSFSGAVFAWVFTEGEVQKWAKDAEAEKSEALKDSADSISNRSES